MYILLNHGYQRITVVVRDWLGRAAALSDPPLANIKICVGVGHGSGADSGAGSGVVSAVETKAGSFFFNKKKKTQNFSVG